MSNEGDQVKEQKNLPPLPYKEFLKKLIEENCVFYKLKMVSNFVEGIIDVENITPEDGQWIRENKDSLSFVDKWCIVVSQVPRLRQLVKTGLLTPKQAVDSLKEFEDDFFRWSGDKKIDHGHNYLTKNPAYLEKFINDDRLKVNPSPLNLSPHDTINISF